MLHVFYAASFCARWIKDSPGSREPFSSDALLFVFFLLWLLLLSELISIVLKPFFASPFAFLEARRPDGHWAALGPRPGLRSLGFARAGPAPAAHRGACSARATAARHVAAYSVLAKRALTVQ